LFICVIKLILINFNILLKYVSINSKNANTCYVLFCKVIFINMKFIQLLLYVNKYEVSKVMFSLYSLICYGEFLLWHMRTD